MIMNNKLDLQDQRMHSIQTNPLQNKPTLEVENFTTEILSLFG